MSNDAATNYYANMSQASEMGKQNPKLTEVGDHIVVIREWVVNKSTNPEHFGAVFDAFEVEVVKTIRGNGSAVGMVRSRVRQIPGKFNSAMAEIAERGLVVSKIAHMDATESTDHSGIVKSPELDARVARWVAGNGKQVAGLLLKVTVGEARNTKGGFTFQPVNYSIPTEADLAGIPGRVGYRLVG